MNNFIISTYLTTAVDPQRNETKEVNDTKYIETWYNSLVHLNLNGVLLHDGLSAEFQAQFPRLTFKQVDTIPKDIQLYDYRWVLYYEFMLNNPCDAVFFTDVSDVKIMRNPFYEFSENIIYCGDERETFKECEWMKSALDDNFFLQLKGFKDLFTSSNIILNCGIFGGTYDIVLRFINYTVSLIEYLRFRPIDKTVDMPLFNYIAYRYFSPEHGFPVNSIFKAYEKRNDVWFIHK
jgi:hypothetical protein